MTPTRPPAAPRRAPRASGRRAARTSEPDNVASGRTASARQPSEVRIALDALRHIVRALRGSPSARTPRALGSAQLFALQEIAEHPGSSVNDVAALTCTHQSSVSVVVQRLVQQGLVVKVASSDDRRRQQLAVTALGRRILAQTPAVAQGALIDALVALPAPERKAFAESLRTVARFVTPGGAATHPPMFFEDEPHGEEPAATRKKRAKT